jgi:dTDP-4-amino-4,6-dideoxygalactose transaminase
MEPPVTKVPLIDLRAQMRPLRRLILADWAQALDSGAFILGPQMRAFEAEAAAYLGVKHAIACNSGTDALFILLRALGIGPGDEVIVPAFSFFATAEAVSIAGAKPVFCDIRADDFLLDLNEVKKALTGRTRAVIPVHLYGLPMDLGPLKRLLKGSKVAIVEDACQAFGARTGAGFAGALGDAAAFSFYPTKNLSAAGDAGMMSTNRDDVAALARQLREHGSPRRYVHERIGYNSRMDELQAAVLRRKLPRLKKWNQARARVAKAYLKGLKGLPLGLPPDSENSVWHQFTLRVPGGRRDALKAHLETQGIASAVFYPGPMHRQKPYASKAWRSPQADLASQEVLSLPMYPELRPAQVRAVIRGVAGFFSLA